MSAQFCIDLKVPLQLEEGIGDLKHEDMGMTMVMHDKNALHRPSHSIVFVVVLQTLQTRGHGGIFFWLGLLRAIDGSACNQ